MINVAILDDYQQVALTSADWSGISNQCEISVFSHHLGEEAAIIKSLHKFDIICCMRERTPFPSSTLKQLKKLKLLVTTGAKNAAIDLAAAKELGIMVCGTQSPGHAAAELAWGLIMSLAKNIHIENEAIRNQQWQTRIGTDLKNQTLGILGLGRHGANVARFAQAFGMRCIAWSQNLTPEHCESLGVEYVDKKALFGTADFISIHLKMGQRNRGLVGQEELECMKTTAFLVNTSRGPIVDESALIAALQNQAIAGVGLDVYDMEPMPDNHPLYLLDNALLTPHIGYVTKQTYHVFYEQTVSVLTTWLSGGKVKPL